MIWPPFSDVASKESISNIDSELTYGARVSIQYFILDESLTGEKINQVI